MGKTKGGLNTKIHLAVDAFGLPVKIKVTSGVDADCRQALALIDGFNADAVFADKAYDTNELLDYLTENDILPVIPAKRNRTEPRQHDNALYRLRHLVENAFLHLKQWRGIATRYAKRADSFLAVIQFKSVLQWLALI